MKTPDSILEPSSAVWIAIPLLLVACSGAHRDDLSAAGPRNPMQAEIAAAAARGLPTRLIASNFNEPGHKIPRAGKCEPSLSDTQNAKANLVLTDQHYRIDQWSSGDSTISWRYGEGIYSVSPSGLYGLEPGQLLRVRCDEYSATAVLAPVTG